MEALSQMSLWLQVYKDKYESISVAEIEEFLNSGFKKKEAYFY